MILKVVRWEPSPLNFHICRDENGEQYRLDLFVNADFHNQDITPEDLVGKTISIERKHPYIEIACGVKIIESEPTSSDKSKGVK